MSEPSIFFSEVNERQGAFHRRSFLLGGFAGAGLLALGGRLAHLQILEAQRYQKLSASNQFNFRLVPPPRGLIVDRNGEVLATNRPNFRLLVVKDGEHEPGATLQTLAHFVPLDAARQERLMREFERTPNRVPVSVMEDMTWEQFSAINVRAPEMPNVTADMGEVRVYPYGGAFAHVIGYVAKVNREDLTDTGPNSEAILLHPGFRIGRQGVEKAFDLDLRGRTGARKVEVDARGREIRNDPDGDILAVSGKTVELTLDVDIQNRALEVMGDESGAIVVMDCRTGDLLCMVSAPSFDANRFVRGLSTAEYRALADYERRPLLDKAMSGTYPPGSTFKMTTALAALSAGINPEERIHCSGGWRFGGRTWRCWRHGGHGAQNMHDAIKNSCDVYFYQVALRMGPDHIARAAKALGFGQAFDIGIPGQRTGVVGSREWKRTQVKRDPTWHPGDSVSYGIGQGYITANGLQLAVMTARLANGRKQLNPRLIKSVGGVEMPPGDEVPNLPFSQEHLDYVRAGMISVANDRSGTAFRQSQLGLGDVMMAGKTGTAQVRSYDGVANRDSRSVRWGLKDHNLYVAFAPIDEPRYAISVIIQHGGLGGATAAAPRAREVMRVALLKDPEIRARIVRPMPLPDVTDLPPVGMAPDGAVAAPPPLEPGEPT
ncbi:penicillin-binding protein 2 [Phenylobacterium sp.]|uniref:penicillin-binding protein 2 n=1 Tax=Phenylobacterium sp. TaxID=1871053 RepID=UPI002731008C|nr:penicillin-binding protein 2 [Phenylobacterium sp.]MDP1875154.1 penicillin-binding protein 2 [Phenylobacterium sp.]MDP3490361.1 penicillin-binding protein 2 [Phenylobacterium sp.]